MAPGTGSAARRDVAHSNDAHDTVQFLNTGPITFEVLADAPGLLIRYGTLIGDQIAVWIAG